MKKIFLLLVLVVAIGALGVSSLLAGEEEKTETEIIIEVIVSNF